jgi:hypothetical protein
MIGRPGWQWLANTHLNLDGHMPFSDTLSPAFGQRATAAAVDSKRAATVVPRVQPQLHDWLRSFTNGCVASNADVPRA